MFKCRNLVIPKKINKKSGVSNALSYFFKSEYNQSPNDNLKSYLGEGVWLGGLAEQLGMYGDKVNLGDFESIANNENPKNGEKIGKKNKGGSKYDYMELTLSAPKDFSILAFLDKDSGFNKYNKILHRAYIKTMKFIEELAVSRGNSSNDLIKCPNLLYAYFQHETSRPTINPDTKDVIKPDMQLHIHTILSKYLADEFGQIRTINRKFLFVHQIEIGTFFRAVIANELRNEGFEIVPQDDLIKTNKGWQKIKSFGVLGITDEQRLTYSKRNVEIEKMAKKLGITSVSGKDMIAQKFKASKIKFDRDELIADCTKQGEEVGINQEFINSLKTFKLDSMRDCIKSDEDLILSSINIYKGKEYLTEKNLILKLTEYSQYVPINPKEKLQRFIDDGLIKKVGKFNYVITFNKAKPSPRQVQFYDKKARFKPARFIREYLRENKVDLKAPEHKYLASIDISSQKPTITQAMIDSFNKPVNTAVKTIILSSYGKTKEQLYASLEELERELRKGNLSKDKAFFIKAKIKEIYLKLEELEKNEKNQPAP